MTKATSCANHWPGKSIFVYFFFDCLTNCRALLLWRSSLARLWLDLHLHCMIVFSPFSVCVEGARISIKDPMPVTFAHHWYQLQPSCQNKRILRTWTPINSKGKVLCHHRLTFNGSSGWSGQDHYASPPHILLTYSPPTPISAPGSTFHWSYTTPRKTRALYYQHHQHPTSAFFSSCSLSTPLATVCRAYVGLYPPIVAFGLITV
jgi:hypothetical protein